MPARLQRRVVMVELGEPLLGAKVQWNMAISIGTYDDILDMSTQYIRAKSEASETPNDSTLAQQRAMTQKSIEIMAQHLVDWDIEDFEGHPVPATVKGLRMLEPEQFACVHESFLGSIGKLPLARSKGLQSTPTLVKPEDSLAKA